MASLVSAGVSVTVIDESFYIPAAAPTVPLIFVATKANKLQPDGQTLAAGTAEHGVVRTVTSIGQSVQLFGVPHFLTEGGQALHGSALNEYGLFALNQFLGIGNLAYVVRANIDTSYEAEEFLSVVKTNGESSVVATDVDYTGVVASDGELIDIELQTGLDLDAASGTDGIATETITVTFTSSTEYTVTGSVSGAIGSGSVDEEFESNIVNFEVAAGTIPFTVSDTLTFDIVYAPTTSPSGAGKGTITDIEIGSSALVGTYTIAIVAPTAGPLVLGATGLDDADLPGPGTGYTNGTHTDVDLAPLDSGSPGAGAKATVVVSGGIVQSVSVTAGGNNYAVGETLTVVGLGGTGFEIVVTSINVSAPTNFSVIGPGSPLPSGTIGSDYTTSDGYLSFLLESGSTQYAPGDTFTIVIAEKVRYPIVGDTDAQQRVTIKTALAAAINSNTEVRSEIYEYNLILAPGFPEVVSELVALATDVNEEAFVIADTPMNRDPEQVATWAMTSGKTSNRNVAYYYPHGLATNLDGAEVVIAASGIALRTYAYSDNVSYVWFAPAGAQRGVVTGVSSVGYVSGDPINPTTYVQANLNQGQRDNLYNLPKNINPITYFPGQGLLVWGQKTAQGVASALDRVNVVREVGYIKRQLRKGAFPFVFEPNDKITRDNLKAAIDGFLNQIMAQRGLYDFVTLCDESNNTPFVIDNNQLIADVALKPVKAAEFIYIPIRVLSTGATMP